MTLVLNPLEARVLAALLEKEITTPEYYPLSLHALVNACNQKSNRDPVMTLGEDAIREALRGLQDQSLARSVSALDSRVTKYEHRLQEAFNFDRREAAILCELLLRGPQTPGELRSRAERMHHFDDLGEVQSTLQRLISRQPTLVKILPRQPGTKESRYTQLLSADVEPLLASVEKAQAPSLPPRTVGSSDRIASLEGEVASLRNDFAELRRDLEQLRGQLAK